jgi:cytoskeletal protein CcmA (bactofilin family)
VLKQIINQDESLAAGESKYGAPIESGSARSYSSSLGMSSTKNILSSDVEIKGKLRFSKELIIDGRIDGEVNSDGDLTVGENAQIVGDIKTRSVVVYGKIRGNITVTDRCEMKMSSELHGDVTAAKLAIEEGAIFMGISTVGGPPKGGSKQTYSAPVSPPVAPTSSTSTTTNTPAAPGSGVGGQG